MVRKSVDRDEYREWSRSQGKDHKDGRVVWFDESQRSYNVGKWSLRKFILKKTGLVRKEISPSLID